MSELSADISEILSSDELNAFEDQDASLEAGEIVRFWRQYANLTQAQLALRVGVSQARISAIERGRGSEGPSYATLRRIARACGLPIGEGVSLALLEGNHKVHGEEISYLGEQDAPSIFSSVNSEPKPAYVRWATNRELVEQTLVPNKNRPPKTHFVQILPSENAGDFNMSLLEEIKKIIDSDTDMFRRMENRSASTNILVSVLPHIPDEK